MSTKILDYTRNQELQPAHMLWQMYDPDTAPHRFCATTREDAEMWQQRTRQALNESIGFQTLPATAPDVERIESVDKGGYIREKILLRTSAFSVMPVYLLLPKNVPTPIPVVLAFHGHGYGAKDIVGLWEDGEERGTPDEVHRDFGVALCNHGFAVAAPEILGFGERQTDFAYLNTLIGQEVPTTCAHTAMLAFHLGGSVVGLRIHEGKRLVDYLETRDELDTSRLGAMGLSGGGMHTFFSTCVDERIRACVVSGYYCAFRHSIFAMHHCACNFVPGLHRFGEIYDLAGLIAPRPMLVESGSYDPIFPSKAVRQTVEKTRPIYTLFQADTGLETEYFEGRHRINGQRAYTFLQQHL